MSEWLDYVKAYAAKNNIPYKQALTAASPSYKTRNDSPPEGPEQPMEENIKTKRKYVKKTVSKC